ncbi:NAD(+)/NADH kinase [Hathewaya histolytica]|uniref:NAD(+)/NADH kinase n=1 Tax=Hathewaya histolytica TaxID=1498 RepID=UPI003B682922
MQRIGININRTKEKSKEVLDFIKTIIYEEIENSTVVVLDEVNLSPSTLKELDMVISLGGDGTILNTSRLLEGYSIPIFGVNIGNLGFLTSSELHNFKEELRSILKNDFKVEDRLLLNCSMNEDDNISFKALNDIVISKGTLSRIVKFNIYIDDSLFTSFKSDGIIISTPTGSTAYSLSAGGPIIYPTLKVIAITPICPHILGMRTLIIDSNSKIVIKPELSLDKIFLTVDGQNSKEMSKNDYITIQSAEKKCKLIRTKSYDYFSVLRDKIIHR